MPAGLSMLGLNTRIGPIAIRGDEDGIMSIGFARGAIQEDRTVPSHMRDARAQLTEYFDGRRRHFTDLPLHIAGSSFLTRVREHLLTMVPFGAVVTYGDIARAIGNPGAVRAVGSACKKNPFIIVVPCHRVLPSSLKTGNYACGVERKVWLLEHEEADAERWVRT